LSSIASCWVSVAQPQSSVEDCQVQLQETFVDQPVVVDGNCITSQGPATALDFDLQLVEQLAGPAARRKVAEAMLQGV
jgi:transcriptional regulator GlxA family with amidase domain